MTQQKWKSTGICAIAALGMFGCVDEPLPSDREGAISYITEEAEVHFVERQSFADEQESPTYDVVSIVRIGSADPAENLLDQGATPLEVFQALLPDETPPASMIQDHIALAHIKGRSTLDVLEYSRWRVDTGQSDVCDSDSAFENYVDTYLVSGYGYEAENLTTANSPAGADILATNSSSKDVRYRACNFYSDRADRFQANVVIDFEGLGAANPWSGFIDDGWRLRYDVSQRNDGDKYLLTATNPARWQSGNWSSCTGSNCSVRVMLAVGWEP